jgi:hypothetical protein
MVKELKFFTPLLKSFRALKNKPTFRKNDDDQFHQPKAGQDKIKINDLEKYLFKAFERQKFPSFHEVLGPALTGFRPVIPYFIPCGKLIPKMFFQLVRFSEIYQPMEF